jgi:hypothetical protein
MMKTRLLLGLALCIWGQHAAAFCYGTGLVNIIGEKADFEMPFPWQTQNAQCDYFANPTGSAVYSNSQSVLMIDPNLTNVNLALGLRPIQSPRGLTVATSLFGTGELTIASLDFSRGDWARSTRAMIKVNAIGAVQIALEEINSETGQVSYQHLPNIATLSPLTGNALIEGQALRLMWRQRCVQHSCPSLLTVWNGSVNLGTFSIDRLAFPESLTIGSLGDQGLRTTNDQDRVLPSVSLSCAPFACYSAPAWAY